jgi:hypothetical protein
MKLIVIGFLGYFRVYINMSKAKAIYNYNMENPEYTMEKNNLTVREFDVKDRFSVYDIWEDNIL